MVKGETPYSILIILSISNEQLCAFSSSSCVRSIIHVSVVHNVQFTLATELNNSGSCPIHLPLRSPFSVLNVYL